MTIVSVFFSLCLFASTAFAAQCNFINDAYQEKLENYVRYSDTLGHRYLNKGVPRDQTQEMHVLVSRGAPTVIVKKSDKPIVLVLSSLQSAGWTIKLDEGAKLKKILLIDAAVLNSRDGLENVDVSHWQGICGNTKFKYATRWEPDNSSQEAVNARFGTFINGVRTYLGLVESSYQASVFSFDEPVNAPLNTARFQQSPLIKTEPDIDWSREQTISFYKRMKLLLPLEAQQTMAVLISFMEANKLPILFPPSNQYRRKIVEPTHFELLSFNPSKVKRPLNQGEKFDCSCSRASSYTYEKNWIVECIESNNCPAFSEAGVLIGNDDNNIIDCSSENQLYWLGSGNDGINDSWGDDIIDAGKGNDKIDAGHGRDIIIYENNWGQDTLNQSCEHSHTDINFAFESPAKSFWAQQRYEYTNFLLFGEGINPSDMKWVEPHILKNLKTGDQVMLENRNCYNLTFFEDGDTRHLNKFDWLEFYEKL